MNNGYKEFFINNKHYYEHRYVAEKMILGRELLSSEVVHHIDGNRANNSPDNLMVFKTTADHSGFHKGAEIYKEGDVWVAKRLSNKASPKNICPLCNKLKDADANLCTNCHNLLMSLCSNKPSKPELEELISKYPFTKIGEMFGVSDNAVRKWCRSYNLPFKRQKNQ